MKKGLIFNFFSSTSRFDKKKIQQVETVGDKYMAVSGLPDICENHAVSIARLALDMIDKADSVMMGDRPIVS